MGKTLDLRKLIKSKLDTITSSKGTYYELADEKCNYPYTVFSFENINLDDLHRDDIILVVDVWSKDSKTADNIADGVEELFSNLNVPTSTILPTFYRYSRKPVVDEDKTIKRRELKFQIQNYER